MRFPLLIVCTLLLLAGCRSGGPVAPSSEATFEHDAALVPVAVSPDTWLLPLTRQQLTIDEHDTVGVAPLETRELAGLGDRFLLDISRAVQGGFGHALKAISVRRIGPGRLGVTLQITHPFPLPDLLQPASDTNRLDLHLFGVHALVLTSAAGTDPGNGASAGVLLDTSLLANPMGYTPAYPTSITGTTTTVHPYRTFFRADPTGDPSNLGKGNYDPATGYADLMAPSGYNIFPQGATATTELILKVATGTTTTLDLLIGASYIDATADDALDKLPNGTNGPDYFAPSGAGTNPWWVTVTSEKENILPKMVAGDVKVTISILDWQVGLVADAGYPDPAKHDGLPEDSNIDFVHVAIPAFSATPVDVAVPIAGGDGFFGTPLVYEATIPNSLGPIGGTYLGLVEVKDKATPGTQADSNPRQTITGKRIQGSVFDCPSTSTYQVFAVTVPPGTAPPIARLVTDESISVGQQIQLAAEGCDTDGVIVEYQWDFDYDGTTFTADRTDPPGADGKVSINVGRPFTCQPTGAPVSIALRAKDNDGLLSVVNCTEPSTGSTFDPATCVLVGDLPRTCATITVTPREAGLMFGTDVNASGAPQSTSPFSDTKSAGQHGLAVFQNQVFLVFHEVKEDWKTGNVYLARSENRGATFGTPINLTNIVAPTGEPGQEPPAGPYAQTPSIALTSTGNPIVAYATGRDLKQDIALKISSDGGNTFGNEILFERTGNQGQPGIVVTNDTTVWVSFVDWASSGGDTIVVGTGTISSADPPLFAVVND
ncbi:MAG: hypothetical protein ABI743_07535, partial [bacterium]